MYVDGSCQGNPCNAGFGGLLRDAMGTWIHGFYGDIGQTDITKEELLAILNGLKIAWERNLDNSDFFISHFSSGEPERNLVVVCHNSTTPFFLEHSSAQRKLWQTESSKSKEDLGEKVMLINSTSCRQRGTGFTVQNAFAAPILDHMKQAMFGARICR
ncbi:hypothetical protein D0Y65_042072 [Glycine soja]|uniref:RNase H type-1 domain-containing protein n=1 Tax=Glycine soja TaxID=3848 RepID=A0A445GYE4_GLYSO|nr:hypothetical protein D0Y65_042072 [Glycine soja]